MNSKASLAILLAVSACIVSSSDAWGLRRSGQNLSFVKSASRNYSIKRNSTYPSPVVLTVRRVDEEHPYYQAFKISSSNASVNGLKQSLREFFNQSSDVTRIVKNDHLLITRDIEVRMLGYRDYLEVWFQDSKAPTRSRTMYSFTKDARKAANWGSSSEKVKSKSSKSSKTKSKREKKRRGDEDAEVEDETQFDFDQF